MLNASHIITGDITYQCIGNDNYIVTFTGYFDCSGILAPTNVDISVSSATCSNSFVHTMTPDASPVEVSQICPSQYSSTSCNGGALYGYEKVVYSDTISLPAQCSDWIFAYDMCCRSFNIMNLQNASTAGFYVEAHVNNTNGLCNNSVNYWSVPIIQTLVASTFNDDQSYNHGTYDVDGDSLEFSIVPSKSNSTITIPYAASISTSNPIFGSTTFNDVTLNGICGTFWFDPNVVQESIITMQTKEWRCINGVKTLVGSSLRDLSFISSSSVSTGNNPPTVWGAGNIQNGYSSDSANIFSHVGDSLHFNIKFWDRDSTGNTTITSNHNESMPGSVVTYNPLGTDVTKWANFSWKIPSSAEGDYILTFKAEDDNCPLRGYTYYSVYLHVDDSTAAPCVQIVSAEEHMLRAQESLFKLYPNPTNGILTLESVYDKNVMIRATSLLGKKIIERELLAGSQGSIDLGDKKGIYIIELVSEEGVLANYKVLSE